MNDNLQAAAVALLERAISGVDASVSFLSAELPDYVAQLLMWNFVASLLCTVVGAVLLLTPVYLLFKYGVGVGAPIDPTNNSRYGNRRSTITHNQDGEGTDAGAAKAAACTVAAVAGLMVVLHNVEWLMIWVAPKVWLVEYASQLVK